MSISLARLALVAALMALLAAGCGGAGTLSAEEYREQLESAQNALYGLSTGIEDVRAAQRTGRATQAELGDAYGTVANGLRIAAERLDGMTPPDDAADAHQRLVAGLVVWADDYDSVAVAYTSGDARKAKLLTARSPRGSGEITQAIDDLRSLGYVPALVG